MTTIKTVHIDDLLGLAEIATRFEVPYSTALSWTRSRSFPAPIKQFKMGPCWHVLDVEDFLRDKKEAK